MESILEVLTPDNLIFIFKGFSLDPLYFSDCHRPLYLIGTVLAVMRNGKILSAHHLQHLHRVCVQRSQPPPGFHHLFGV